MTGVTKLGAGLVAAAMIVALAPLADAGGLKATLIEVHEIRAADFGKGGEKGPPDGKGPPGGGGDDGGGTANCSNDNTSAYTGDLSPTGWTVGGATTAYLNPDTVPSNLGDVTSTMQAAFDVWRGGNVPKITVEATGTLTKEKANQRYDIMFGRTSGNAIAVAYTWRWSNGAIESDVVFNQRLSWFKAGSEGDGCIESAGAAYDVQNIAAHEYGHVYGAGHPDGSRFETMHAYGYTGETLKRSPTPGEKSKLVALY